MASTMLPIVILKSVKQVAILRSFSQVVFVLIVFTALSVGSGFLIHLLATGDGGFGNSGDDFGGSDGGGGGGGAGGGGFWSRLQSYLVTNAKEDESQSKWGPYTIA
ncbi:hypothetical protein POM88_035615 [Heracleum sosnowskyi]|uniref:Uncharacterized protein n=1 Tax=Heracleum sosnowskyi TaxID=360622 RepID=A0AAD8HNJ1_9APIA|nr:hypothetical protein POM88_035615 [Heracleum sosnowskyi]